MKKKFWSADKLVSFAAIFISVMSLFIFKKQTNIMEEQSHLSVMPYLMLETSNNGFDKKFYIEFVNHGVGPAIIESRRIIYKGQSYDMEFIDFIEDVAPDTDSINIISSSSIQPGFSLPAGRSRTIIIAGGSERSYNDFLKFMQTVQSEDFNYEIVYKSIYNDRWKITSQEEIPIKLEDD